MDAATRDFDDPDNGDIWVLGERGGPRNVTNKLGVGTDRNASWSPDGRRIVFERDAALYIVGADGTGLVRLTNAGPVTDFSPDWSPDGSRITFARFQVLSAGYVELGELTGAAISDDVMVINADGTAERSLTGNFQARREKRVGGNSAPVWSPDGTRIAFSDTTSEGEPPLKTIAADGTGLTSLGVNGHNPTWRALPGTGRRKAKGRVKLSGVSVTRSSLRVRYRLSAAARVRIGVEGPITGVRANRTCLPLRRGGPKCKLWFPARTKTVKGKRGLNTTTVSGSAQLKARLRSGRYRLAVSVLDGLDEPDATVRRKPR